jgi:hypothetical protein
VALADAYASEFAMLPPKAPELLNPSPELSPEERTTASLLILQHTLATCQENLPDNPSFRDIIKSIIRTI